MKRIFSLSLFACLAFLAGCTSPRKSTLEESGMKGKIKQMTDLVNNHPSGRFIETDSEEEKTEYDVMRVLDFYPNGNLKNLRLILENGTTVQKYLYDKDSLLSEVQYFENGKMRSYETYTYNSKGLKENIAVKDTSGALVQTVKYKYDGKGNKIEQVDLFPGGEKQIQTFKYDHKNQLVEKTTQKNGVSTGIKEKYLYDKDGNLSEISSEDTMFDSFTMVQRIRYKETDSLGNWTYRETEGFTPGSKEGTVIQTWERLIEYY